MRIFFQNFKTIVGEFIGLIGGLLWARNTNWDPEPLILLTISGMGLIISILLLIFKEKNPEPLSPSKLNIDMRINENLNSPINDINPQTIKKQIKDAPLFQQEDIANHFIGLSVEWPLKLFSIHKRGNDKIIVTMEPLDRTYIRISFNTDTGKYPIFKIAQDEKAFLVSGKIINCGKHDIELELTTLKEI